MTRIPKNKAYLASYTTSTSKSYKNPSDHTLASLPTPSSSTNITFQNSSTFPRLLKNNPHYKTAFLTSIYQHSDLRNAFQALSAHILAKGYKEEDENVIIKMRNDVQLHGLRKETRELLFKYDILKKFVKVDTKGNETQPKRVQLLRGLVNESQKRYHDEHKGGDDKKVAVEEKKGLIMRLVHKLFFKKKDEK